MHIVSALRPSRLRLGSTAVLALALVTLAAAPRSGRAAEPFTINAIIPETGAAAFLGKEESQSLHAIEAMVNRSGGIGGQPIAFAIYDDQSSPQIGVQLLNTILAKKPAVVLGSSFVSTCSAMAPLVAESGPVEYCFSPGIHPKAGSYVFSASVSTTALLAVAQRFFHERGWTKVAAITSTDATGQDADHGIDDAFLAPGSGESIVDRQHFNPSDVSVTAQMTDIQASGAQAVIAWTTGTPFATLLRGANNIGLNIPMLTTSGNLTYAQMKDYAPFMSKELYFSGYPWVSPDQVREPDVKRAVDAYIDAFKPLGIRPDVGQSLAWDSTLLVIEAFKHLGTGATATQIRDYLDSIGTTQHFVGIYGKYDFKAVPQRGLDSSSVVMARWEPQKTSWVAVSQPGGALIAESKK
jgi:branched-chain amino acid transport system substrate-binding protein